VNGLHPLLGKRVVVTDQDTGQRTTGTLHGLRQAASTSLVLLNDEADRIELRGNLTIEAEDEPNT
jgi:hypothetical protein